MSLVLCWAETWHLDVKVSIPNLTSVFWRGTLGFAVLRFWPFFALVFWSFRFWSSVLWFSTAPRFVFVSPYHRWFMVCRCCSWFFSSFITHTLHAAQHRHYGFGFQWFWTRFCGFWCILLLFCSFCYPPMSPTLCTVNWIGTYGSLKILESLWIGRNMFQVLESPWKSAEVLENLGMDKIFKPRCLKNYLKKKKKLFNLCIVLTFLVTDGPKNQNRCKISHFNIWSKSREIRFGLC